MKKLAVVAAVAIMAVSIAPAPAGAQDTIDPRLDMTSVDLSVSPDGNLVAQVTPAQASGNQLIADLFSWFFAFDISNDLVQAGMLLQTHDGVVTVNGLLSTPTETREAVPKIFFGPDGEWIRFVLEISLAGVIPGFPALSWLLSAATMSTPTSARAESPWFGGQLDLPADLPTRDPRAGAIGELGPDGQWVAIVNPVPAVVALPPEAPTSVPVATPKPEPTVTEPTITESAAQPSVAPAAANGGQGGANGGSGAVGGNNAFWVFSIVAFLLMITMFLYLRGRRTRRRGLEIDSVSARLNNPSYTWDLPAELGEIYTDMTDAERRQAIKDFAAVEDKKAYIDYFKALQKFQSGQGGPVPPQKPPGI